MTDAAAAPAIVATLAPSLKNSKFPLGPKGYCWSHGYKVTFGHTSKSCKHRMNNQNEENTTRENLQNGCTWKKAWIPKN